LYNEKEEKNTKKDKFIIYDINNENEQKLDENENQLQQNYRNNIDNNIYENIIEEKNENENDDSIKNNEYFENLDEEDNGIDSFRPKQEQKSPEFINKKFSIYNNGANSNINNKKK